MHCMKQTLLLLLLLLSLAAPVAAESAPAFSVPWSTMESGHDASVGGDFSLSGTLGQMDAHTSRSGEMALEGGFWTVLRNGRIFRIALPTILRAP